MEYIFYYSNPSEQFLDIDLLIENNGKEILEVQLPAWRPGRYELGNFAKNIRKWEARDGAGNLLQAKKLKKDLWQVNTKGASTIKISYNYYAAELNAGSTWLDERQLYVNPVNCCLYLPDRMGEECKVTIKAPENFQIATGMVQKAEKQFLARDFHELADSPFIASASLRHNRFECLGVNFHIWFQGLDKPDWDRLLGDFKAFAITQIEMFGDFPVKDYHFLFQVLPYPAYHGVEHLTSTVISLGPVYSLFSHPLYNELLGVSSHELFHTWNVKMIRPLEMMPYNYASENYSRLGWVAEGFTTYYGDTMLLRSGVFTEGEFFEVFAKQFKKHFDNPGRFSLSVGDSSFDTWLDGYTPGVPNRKTSIYTEGCLVTFMLDVFIRRNSSNQKSMDDVLRRLYHDFAKSSKGFSEQDVLEVINEVAGMPMDVFFASYIYGTRDFKPQLMESLDYLGLEMVELPAQKFTEARFGFKAIEEVEKVTIKMIYPGSVAERAGLMVNDMIVAVNGHKLNNNLQEWCSYFFESGTDIELTVYSAFGGKQPVLKPEKNESYYNNYEIRKKKEISPEQLEAFQKWAR